MTGVYRARLGEAAGRARLSVLVFSPASFRWDDRFLPARLSGGNPRGLNAVGFRSDAEF